jgi:hypothetical protein
VQLIYKIFKSLFLVIPLLNFVAFIICKQIKQDGRKIQHNMQARKHTATALTFYCGAKSL